MCLWGWAAPDCAAQPCRQEAWQKAGAEQVMHLPGISIAGPRQRLCLTRNPYRQGLPAQTPRLPGFSRLAWCCLATTQEELSGPILHLGSGPCVTHAVCLLQDLTRSSRIPCRKLCSSCSLPRTHQRLQRIRPARLPRQGRRYHDQAVPPACAAALEHGLCRASSLFAPLLVGSPALAVGCNLHKHRHRLHSKQTTATPFHKH